jgi:hypothetical protein
MSTVGVLLALRVMAIGCDYMAGGFIGFPWEEEGLGRGREGGG